MKKPAQQANSSKQERRSYKKVTWSRLKSRCVYRVVSSFDTVLKVTKPDVVCGGDLYIRRFKCGGGLHIAFSVSAAAAHRKCSYKCVLRAHGRLVWKH